MAKKENKTNCMRILDEKGIKYTQLGYECDEFVDGIQAADMLGLPHEKVYKTLVTRGKSGNFYVFVINIEAELDLKKSAKTVNEKSIEMIHVKDIMTITGYVRGGCTAIGMKKNYPVIIDENVLLLNQICVSGGRIGSQVCLSTEDFMIVASALSADIIKR